jgi:hypothetical protein
VTSKRTLVPGKLRDPEAPKIGRPSKVETQFRQTEEILEAVSAGTPLKTVCQAPGLPTPAEFRRWVRADPELARQYELARRDMAHALFDEMTALAHELATGTYGKDDNAVVGAKRAAIDALKHLTARLLPGQYADQKAVNQGVQVTIVSTLPLGPGSVAEKPIDTAFRVVGRLAPPSEEPLDE